jgi:hypothetical protein
LTCWVGVEYFTGTVAHYHIYIPHLAVQVSSIYVYLKRKYQPQVDLVFRNHRMQFPRIYVLIMAWERFSRQNNQFNEVDFRKVREREANALYQRHCAANQRRDILDTACVKLRIRRPINYSTFITATSEKLDDIKQHAPVIYS